MTANRKAGGADVALTTRNKRVGGAWVQLATGKKRVSGAWVEVLEQPLAASGPPNVTGSVHAPEPAPTNTPVMSMPATVTATGGTGIYTYTWSHVSGDAVISTDAPSAATTTFSASVLKNNSRSAVRRCTVSDGVSTATHDVSVILEYTTDL